MPGPKSILLHLDSTSASGVRTLAARSVAEAFDAEVTAFHCMTPVLMRYPFSLDSTAEIIGDLQRRDDARKSQARQRFEELRGGSGKLVWEESEEPWSFGQRALYADLIILGRQWTRQEQGDNPGSDDVPFDFVPHVLVGSGRPTLVVPSEGQADPMGGTILVAWKETRESARAVAAALPWLRRAHTVHLACYDEGSRRNLHRLQRQLDAQGVRAKLHQGSHDDREVGKHLLSLAADLRADLLVMGCYGHSRSFEWVLGGATRTILHSTTVPVLMAH